MTEIIGVRFSEGGKVYYFSPGQEKLQMGDKVIVETSRGVECGEVAIENRMIEDNKTFSPLKTTKRRNNYADDRRKNRD